MISAEIIADSKNQYGQRITTYLLRFPRIILAELNTHRMFSRNSASSRAIPFEKMVKMVEENPFIPMKWMKDHRGMQGNEYFENEDYANLCSIWLDARDNAVKEAIKLSKIGLTKQIVNRLLEPFMYHTAIVTATDWENFFSLRANYAAEIHLQQLAFLMLEAYNNSHPKELKDGEWHIPFGDKIRQKELESVVGYIMDGSEASDEEFHKEVEVSKLKIATARCARVSYLNFEGKDDYHADLNLFDQLNEQGHWSAFEHCAKAMTNKERCTNIRGEITFNDNGYIAPVIDSIGWCGNFRGFIQLRKTMQNENRSDERVLKTW